MADLVDWGNAEVEDKGSGQWKLTRQTSEEFGSLWGREVWPLVQMWNTGFDD